ncbi:Thrombospondin type 3 repeat-containing protein [Solitalea koreensis]|uniref:Thrombospondin type 3 repeat-containing protein n=1 Tax=Solitalea koreensis TaxID=543615 RepID=A0A521DI62_9SPHI|nr:Thrombospondin type 3 repeat-containing protein [Solitalea koreensis]
MIMIAALSCESAHAQQFLGLRGSNYAGIYNVFYNPAEIVDSRFSFDMNLISFSTTASNNFGSINRNYLFDKGFLKLNVKDDAGPYWSFTNDNKVRSGVQNSSVMGPSFMFSFGKKKQNAIALFSKANMFTNIDGITSEFAELVNDDFGTEALKGKPITMSNFRTSTVGWGEVGLTYGRVLLNAKQNFLKGAISAKYVRGYVSGYLNSNTLSIQLVDPQNSAVKISNSDLSMAYSNNFNSNGDFQFDKIAGRASGAVDLGLVYEYRPKYENFTYEMDQKKGLIRHDKNKYLFKAAISITDLGPSLKFDKGTYSREYKNMNADNYDISGLPSPADAKEFVAALDADFTNSSAAAKEYEFGLPTSMNANLDYRIGAGFYVNANAFMPLSAKNKVNAHFVNIYSVTPRFETGGFGAYFPVSYTEHKDLNVGLTFRAGPFLVGTSTIAPFFGKQEIRAADIHFGFKIPVRNKILKDRDKDKISDKKDKCKDIAGSPEFWGCPDTDGDGVPDSEDKCILIPGKKEFSGCPDTDNDGVPDSEDKCPDIAGKKELGGCPDSDNDGIIDSEDKCPDLAGPKELNGCPDTDGDGIIDPEDKCPTEKGTLALHGCPFRDADGDGVEDELDACPTVAGPVENKGCPYPDTDGDGVLDKDDLCPHTPGDVNNHGCPVIKEEAKKVLEKAFDKLEFTTGQSVIRSTSFASLTELAQLMKENPAYKLKIEGHTDNVGSRNANMILSKNRSNAVKNFLVKKGVKATQFVVNWFGPDKPIEDNSTATGRQANRRVEMTIVFE